MELVLQLDGTEVPSTLMLPNGRARAGVVALHGAEAGHRSFFVYEHLADVLPAGGIAVLRYDRRPSLDGRDVPLHTQASDAMTAARILREHIDDAPVGLWGFSQGAWAALLAAATHPAAVAFLVCVSSCGVSPATQMRIGCARQLLKAGHTERDVTVLTATRMAVEDYLRGDGDRAATQALLDRSAAKPWFTHAYLPRTLPAPGTWPDMDFDPKPSLARLAGPVLVFYGETDEWIPVDDSVAAWHEARRQGTLVDLTVERLRGADHLPTLGGEPERDAIIPAYTETLTRWLRSLYPAAAPPLGTPDWLPLTGYP